MVQKNKNKIVFLILIVIGAGIIFALFSSTNSENPNTLDTNGSINYLSSWNDGNTKNEIMAFVKDATDEKSKNFVPVENRLATFDLDGTLQLERSQYAMVQFLIEGMRDKANNDDDLAKTSPFKEILNNSSLLEHGKEVVKIPNFEKNMPLAYEGISQKEFIEKANAFFNSNHPQCKVPYKKLIYQPMLELIHYLQENDFNVYISTGSSIGFVRSVSSEIFDILPENVIGSTQDLKFDEDKREVIRLGTWVINVHDQKPIFIQQHTGQLPIFACGNTMGDKQMLEAATFSCIVDHDDDAQDALYRDEIYPIAQEKDWTIISMKNDFHQVFPDGINCKVVD